MIKKLNVYGAWVIEGKTVIYQFPYLVRLKEWIGEPDKDGHREQVYATGPLVRRALRLIAAGDADGFPVKLD